MSDEMKGADEVHELIEDIFVVVDEDNVITAWATNRLTAESLARSQLVTWDGDRQVFEVVADGATRRVVRMTEAAALR